MTAPCHLIAYVGARSTMCGQPGDTLPVLWLYWLPAHELGHGARSGIPWVVCEGCQVEVHPPPPPTGGVV